MANYLLYKHHVKDGPPTEVIGVAGAKNAKIRAYRIAMREKGNLDYIGIKTVTASHNMYSKYTAKVKYADGKVWYTSGRKKREMLSNGDFVSDQNPRKGEDIFAWYKGEKKPAPRKAEPKKQSDFVKNHIIVARPAPAVPVKYIIKGQRKEYPDVKSALKAARAYVTKVGRETGDAIMLTIEVIKGKESPVPIGYVRDGFFSSYQTQIISMQMAGKLRGNGPFIIYEDAYNVHVLKADGSYAAKL